MTFLVITNLIHIDTYNRKQNLSGFSTMTGTMTCRFLVGLFFLGAASAIDTSIYRTCEERYFCNRLRNKEAAQNFDVVVNGAIVLPDGISLFLRNRETNRYVDFNITILEQDTVRIWANEVERTRYHIPYVLQNEPSARPVNVVFHETSIELSFAGHLILINTEDFQIAMFTGEQEIVNFNRDKRFTMYSAPYGTEFAFDIFFPQAIRSYGIPEHADYFALRTTVNTPGPYRLYNSDTPAYDLNSRLGLYGSVPFLIGHGTRHTGGVFLANAGEQWVDIENTASGVTAYWMVENGGIDVYAFLGPTPTDVSTQYIALTGVTPIPQLWTLGYHQSSWNYLDQDDITEIVAEFDNNNIPIDAIWGDVETQDDHRYFTWNPDTFSNPIAMLNNLSSTHRKFITHVAPQSKVDPDYSVYAEAKQRGYFVKNRDGSDFVDVSLPGESSWIDFFNEEAADWYSGLFSYDKFSGTNSALGGIWNDMNEPAVYNVTTENTISRSVVFNGEIPQDSVHNMYGFTQVRATYDGLMQRDNREVRPFILSRSFFAGSQRYAAVWTGNNLAEWPYVGMSYAMCLSISLVGIPFCGADIGGFFGDADTELLTRWYQAGAWLPFFRAHSSNGTERREPYLFENEVQDRIRAAIQQRYLHLPLFYTLFHEHSRFGYPVIRPVFYEYPNDINVVEIQDQLFLGSHVMVKAIDQPNATSTPVYFPGGQDQLWYDIDTPLLYRGFRWLDVDVTLDRIPVFYKGGSIVFRRTNVRRNTYEMQNDVYTVYVFLNDDNEAHGTIYQDDYQSFNYARREYSYFAATFANENAALTPIDPDMPISDSNLVIGSYVLFRPPRNSRDSNTPVPVKPIVITKTADGRNIRDLRFDPRKRTSFKLDMMK